MTRDILVIYVSIVSSQSAFSTGVEFYIHFVVLSLIIVEALICVQNWLRYVKQNINDLQVEINEAKKLNV